METKCEITSKIFFSQTDTDTTLINKNGESPLDVAAMYNRKGRAISLIFFSEINFNKNEIFKQNFNRILSPSIFSFSF